MAARIHSNARLGYIHLTVRDLARAQSFYRRVLGLRLRNQSGDTTFLGTDNNDLLALTENPDARRMHGTTGLDHWAITVPSRAELAQWFKRIAMTGIPLEDSPDPRFSDSIYLRDPDGNGIEVYYDRPPCEGCYVDKRSPQATDLPNEDDPWAALAQEGLARGLTAAASLGHVHLHVANLREAEAFYAGLLGFHLAQRLDGTASFVSLDGHQHLAFNTCLGRGAPPPPRDPIGLRYMVLHLPNDDELGAIVNRVRRAGLAVREIGASALVRDPSQNGLLLTTASS
jgi:catechol 2,3-dioxygenase